jgi:hypothetical protein
MSKDQEAPTTTQIEAKHGTLRWRTDDGTDTGKKVEPQPGQSVWLEADKDGNAEAVITSPNPLPDGTFEQTVAGEGLIYG